MADDDDFKGITNRARAEADAQDSEAAIESEKWKAGTRVLRDIVVPLLEKAEKRIKEEDPKVSCNIYRKYGVAGGKSRVEFWCAGASIGSPGRGGIKTLSTRAYFECDNTSLVAYIDEIDTKSAPVQRAKELIDSVIVATLGRYYLKLGRPGS